MTDLARRIFSDDKYATETTGITIDSVTLDKVVCSLLLKPHHRNAKGAVMGGVLFTLADFAFAIAANSNLLPAVADGTDSLHWVSSSSSIHFLTQPKGDTIRAVSNCIRQGRNQALYQINIYDDFNRLVALVNTSGSKI